MRSNGRIFQRVDELRSRYISLAAAERLRRVIAETPLKGDFVTSDHRVAGSACRVLVLERVTES